MTNADNSVQHMTKRDTTLIVAGAVTAIVHVSANMLVGGYAPPLRGGLGIVLWVVAILAQLLMWSISVAYAVITLWRKDYRGFGLALGVFVLVSVPIFLPLPGLFAK